MLMFALIVFVIFAGSVITAFTQPRVERSLMVAEANRQYMIDNKTSDRPFH